MTTEENILKSIELIQAVNNNDLSSTIDIVEYFNNNLKSANNLINFDLHLASKINEYYNNESFIYMIDNLNVLKDSSLKWTLNILTMQKSEDSEEIEKFITEKVEQINNFETYQINSLIELCLSKDRYDLLDLIYEKLKANQ